jgi:hypothetical protein
MSHQSYSSVYQPSGSQKTFTNSYGQSNTTSNYTSARTQSNYLTTNFQNNTGYTGSTSVSFQLPRPSPVSNDRKNRLF